MDRCVAILATMDTKGAESDHLRAEIARLGGKSMLIDIGVVGEAATPVDISAAEIAQAGGTPLSSLRSNPNRADASAVMVRGATATLRRLIDAGKVHSVISLGGTQGTNNTARVMQELPYGFPKLIVSTMAAGDTSPYVGIKDITMMFSVSDILGLNSFLRRILTNAAGAAYGMAQAYQPARAAGGKPMVAISNLGVLTKGAMRAMAQFEALGYETIVFHAVGAGGRAMEQMMEEGLLAGVLDYGLGDIADAVHGGLRAADANRLTVAARLGLPQVVAPGGIDHLGIQLATPNTVPEAYKRHLYSYHNPMILVPRPNRIETRAIVAEIAKRLEGATANTVFLFPLRGVSSYSAPGGALHDAAADAELLGAVRELLPTGIERVEVDANAEDPAFVTEAVNRLVGLIEARGRA